MKMSDELGKALGKDSYDFYSCYKCGRLITAVQMVRSLHSDGNICKCGSKTVKPSNIQWFHWFYPEVLYFAYLRLRGIA
jgi:DNA-directed RNA polymerase subunit RPC12/RpoP